MNFDREVLSSVDRIFSSFEDIVFLIDKGGYFKHVVTTAQNILIAPPDEFLGKHYSAVMPESISLQISSAFQQIDENNKSVVFEYSLKIRGEEDWFSARIGSIYDDANNIDGYVALIRRITQKKQIEFKLIRKEKMLEAIAFANKQLLENTNILDAISNGIRELGIASGADRCYLFENGYNEELGEETTSQKFEWNSGSAVPQIDNPELQDVPFSAVEDFLHPMIARTPLNAIVSQLPEGGLKESLEAQDIISVLLMPIYVGNYFWGFVGFDDCQNERIWSESEVSLLESYAVSMASAITRKSMEDDLKRSKENAETASQAKTEFLANISHEIRTPLNGVIGFLSLLSETPLSEEQKLFINNLNHSADVLNTLISDILDFSKIDAGVIAINPSRIVTSSFLTELENMVRYQYQKDGNVLKIIVSDEVPDIIVADSVRLKQVLVNLLSNGSKFTDHGEIKLTISLKNDALLHFEVVDEGIGIKKENIDDIFNPFIQLDLSRTKKYQGSGLGLSICKKILQAMNSDIHVESEPGRGSRFWFELNLGNNISLDNSVFEERTEEKFNLDADPILSILIVDDNEMNILLASIIAKKNYPGSEITLAHSGIEAIKLIEKNKYSVIFLDLHMPDLDGFQTFIEMKVICSDLCPVIALTADASDTARERSIEIGMDGILLKPFSQNDFREIIESTFLTRRNRSII